MSARDANDVLRDGGPDALRKAFDNAPRSTPKPRRNPLDPQRRDLLVSAWRKRELPARDYLLDSALSTTARWLISGDTGVGKTLLALELGFAMAAGADFLKWKGVRSARVMYIDGEMPAETMKERIETAAAIYGNEVQLYAYNRDDLGPDAIPALNKPEGQTWLWREIEAVKPDAIIFDSMMCLLVGPLSEEETWAPCLPLIRQLSARRIAQVWLNHTSHDATRSFGTKTKEWEFDGVILLSKHPTDDTAVLLQFTKARLRTPKTAGLFKPQLIRRAENGWTTEAASVGGPETIGQRKLAWLKDVYLELADGVAASLGHDGAPVRKVDIDAIRHRMIERGYLTTEEGKLPGRERTAFQRAKEALIRAGMFASDGDTLWSLR